MSLPNLEQQLRYALRYEGEVTNMDFLVSKEHIKKLLKEGIFLLSLQLYK